MSDNIRWFRCVIGSPVLTIGKLYPATMVDNEGDLAVVDDVGNPRWVVITESYKSNSHRVKGTVNGVFEEVFTDEND